MKNKFGFIPIVLPVLVMVLIIGLINLAGTQTAQAQEADVSEEDARLTSLSLTYTEGGTASDNLLMPDFEPGRGDYTAMVDYQVSTVTLTPGLDGSDTQVTAVTGASSDLTALAEGVTTIEVTVTDADDTTKTAKYVIKLTKKARVIPANGALLANLELYPDPADEGSPGTALSLLRLDGGGVPSDFTTINGVNMFKVSVDADVRSVLVVPTVATGITVSEIVSSGTAKRAARATFDLATATDTNPLGNRVSLEGRITADRTTVIKVRTTVSGASAEYTVMVTRLAPKLAEATGFTFGVTDTTDLATTYPTINALNTTGYDADKRSYDLKVPFAVDSTTLVVADPNVGGNDGTHDDGRHVLKRITENGSLATTSAGTPPHVVDLPVGKTVVGIEVDQWVKNFYGNTTTVATDGVVRGSTSTGMYTITIEREKPKLALNDDTVGGLEGDGLRLRYGVGAFGSELATERPDAGTDPANSYGLNIPYDPDKTSYEAEIPFQHTMVTLHAVAGASPASGSDTNKVSFESPADADTGNRGHQVKLSDDEREKTVVIRARSDKDRRIYTEYKVKLTLAQTKLSQTDDVFGLCEGERPATNNCLKVTDTSSPTTGQIVLKSATSSALVLFNENTMAYDAEVDYEINVATLNVTLDPSDTTGRRVEHTMPVASKGAGPVTSTLMVGDTVFKVDVGVENNTSTYMVTLTRNEPKPQLQFTVLDSAGISLGSGPLEVTLDAASRSYNLIKETDITDDDLLTATDVRVCVADADDGDLNDVRVSINGVTVPDCSGGNGGNYLERELNEVTTNLEFDIDHPGDQAGTLHTVSISRSANSVPVFPANHILRSRTDENGVLAVHGMTITPTVELPMAVSGTGNPPLEYELLSVEADGPSMDLPQGLTYDLPTASGNGKLKMSPSILGSSDRAVFNLILKVSDSDAITTSEDEDTIPFTIIVFRDESLLPPGAVIEPRLGDLSDLQVLEERPAGKKTNKLMPMFSLLTYSYEADVFTDTTKVDFVATANEDATVRLEGNETSNQTTTGGNTTHTWEGYRLNIGPGARNTYRVTVEEGSEPARTYTVRVERELAKRPTFGDASAVMAFYEGIPLDDLPDSAAMLPEAEGGNGDLDYKLVRKRADAPAPKYDFLGLNLDMGKATSTRMLSGGPPQLDRSTADLFRESDRSEAYGVLTVNDADMNRTASDSDTMNIDVKVYRDVTLASYTVSGRSSGALGPMSKVYNPETTYSHEKLASYRFNAAHDVAMVTFVANPNGARAEVVSIMPADSDGDSSNGHQVNLTQGNNVITVTVGNGVVRGTHLINIKRPGLQLTGITINEDEDARDNSRLSDEVELVQSDGETKGFDRDEYSYTATVETWVRSVQVRATAADPNARVFVNTFEIPEREGYSVVDLDIGETTITLGASVGTDEPDPRYTVVITRKSSSAPAFEMDAKNYTRMEGVDVKMAPCKAIILPEAMGGDGALTYSLVNQEQLPPGLFFNATTREITGIPTLDEGYESDFDLILAVRDADADTSDADGDTTSFTIKITNDQAAVDADCAVTQPEDELPANQLSSLLVTYTLDGQTDIPATMWSPTAFMPSSGGPYTVSIPFGATDVQVTAVRADAGATISMNSVRIADGVKLDLPPQAAIAVRHPDFTESMVYTLVTERVSNTAPTFGGATIDDQVFESGMDIDAMTLPAATGGNRTITYTLVDHEGNVPEGLMFNDSSRELTGRPALVQDADSTLYRMTYKATDADGQSDMIMFNITVCDPDRASGCTPTMPEPNPGYTPMDLMVERSGTSATITWRPGDDATKHLVGAWIADHPTLSASATLKFAELAGDADTHTFDDLIEGSTYYYVVFGYDSDPGAEGWKDANGVAYMDLEQGPQQ